MLLLGSGLSLGTQLTAPRLAAAQATGAQKETARTLMDEADRLVAARDLEGALKRYQAAHDLMHVPTTGLEVARTQAALGKLVEARAMAIEVSNSALQAGEPPVFADARVEAAQLAQSLADRVAAVVLSVTPPEAAVHAQIDATEIPSAALGLPFKVNPGEHQLRISAAGYESVEQSFSVKEAQELPLVIALKADPTAPTVVASGSEPAAPNEPAKADKAAVPAENGAFTRGIIALGVAGVGLGVGAVTGILTLNKVSDAEKFCTAGKCTSEAQPLLDSADTTALIADIGFGVGIVALGYGLYELIFNQPSAAPPTTSAARTGSPADRLLSNSRLNVALGENTWLVNLSGKF